MRRGKLFSWAGLAVSLGVLAVLVAACNTGGGNSKLSPDKQIVKLALNAGGQDISTLDPAITEDVYSYQAEQLIFPQLVTWDANLNVIPWAAQSLPTISSNGLTYTYKIRTGMKWSDGTPITATTFAYSINRALDPCTGSALSGFFLAPISGAGAFSTSKCDASSGALDPTDSKTLIGKSIIVVDPQTLEIKLGAPATYFSSAMMTSSEMAVPEQLITKYGLKDWINHLQGFGGSQYTLKVWDHKGALDFVANPTFWGGAPSLHEVDFTIYKDPATGYTDYLNGRIHVASPSIDQYTSAKSRSDFHTTGALNIGYIAPNWGVAPFNNVGARQAFDLALDKTVLANNIEHGTVTASNHMVPQGQPGYFPGLKGPDGQVNDLSGNPTKAKQLLQAYANANCSGSFAKCPTIVYYTTNDSGSLELSNAILNQWRTTFPGYNIVEHPVTFP
ncbi:MAG TPA: ABC transporter substrate-binding protein, partial [Ktedonobacterales bacterium]|nr:ABC transporter substrate-binding protein [Ktedonobacterales bacterium]